MDKSEFSARLKNHLRPGMVMKNPGKGSTVIVSCDGERIKYRRGLGKSPFSVNVADLWDACEQFSGRSVTTTELKAFRPAVFSKDGGGHDCHATVFMQALRELKIVESISGSGVSGRPFLVTLPAIDELD